MSTIYTVIIAAIFIACIASFIILFISKVNLRNFIIARAPKIISELFSCDFCLCFWISLILAIILAIIFNNINIIITPIISTPIARFLL